MSSQFVESLDVINSKALYMINLTEEYRGSVKNYETYENLFTSNLLSESIHDLDVSDLKKSKSNYFKNNSNNTSDKIMYFLISKLGIENKQQYKDLVNLIYSTHTHDLISTSFLIKSQEITNKDLADRRSRGNDSLLQDFKKLLAENNINYDEFAKRSELLKNLLLKSFIDFNNDSRERLLNELNTNRFGIRDIKIPEANAYFMDILMKQHVKPLTKYNLLLKVRTNLTISKLFELYIDSEYWSLEGIMEDYVDVIENAPSTSPSSFLIMETEKELKDTIKSLESKYSYLQDMKYNMEKELLQKNNEILEQSNRRYITDIEVRDMFIKILKWETVKELLDSIVYNTQLLKRYGYCDKINYERINLKGLGV